MKPLKCVYFDKSMKSNIASDIFAKNEYRFKQICPPLRVPVGNRMLTTARRAHLHTFAQPSLLLSTIRTMENIGRMLDELS